jgi:hypothetical protein
MATTEKDTEKAAAQVTETTENAPTPNASDKHLTYDLRGNQIEVTAKEWHDKKLGEQGFERPSTLPPD